jgi:catechol 2,3-dioxygenase-like lactoylglutathione lyase family enzyme
LLGTDGSGLGCAISEKPPARRYGNVTLMRIKLMSIHVDDQEKAAAFYGDVLGFVKKHDLDVGGGFRWLTFVSPGGQDDTELVLEPNANPVAKAYQDGLLKQGIPATAFEVDDVDAEYKRLRERGVVFTADPKVQGPVKLAIFADTCGNLIQIYQPPTEGQIP